MTQIKFGTDGWRDLIADQFTFGNLRIVVQGIAAMVINRNLGRRGIVIGYDNRFLSREFAEAAGRVLTGNGVKVFLPDKPLPTPAVAFAVRHHRAGGAIMITASHNPPQYNGLKFIPEYAGPALPDITDEIEAEIALVSSGAKIYELTLKEADKLELITRLDIDSEYFKQIHKLVQLPSVTGSAPVVVVDPMFGAGIGYLENILGEAGYRVVAINNRPDPLFGGGMPEPTDKLLGDLKAEVLANHAIIGLALDGDADRFGIVDDQGTYVPPNRVLSLLLAYLLRTRSFRGPVARSLATTHLLDRVAEAFGLGVIETPVGFKYIGECLREKGCVMGGEESGGMSILGHVPEKDGILACLLVAEMTAATGKTIRELQLDFVEQYGNMESERIDVHYEPSNREQVLGRLNEYRPRQVLEQEVMSISEREGKKILLEDGSWILIRVSGTEPVFRIYVEAPDNLRMRAIQSEIRTSLGI